MLKYNFCQKEAETPNLSNPRLQGGQREVCFIHLCLHFSLISSRTVKVLDKVKMSYFLPSVPAVSFVPAARGSEAESSFPQV